jgi:alpha-1,2-mannosyltransferase
MRIEPTPSLSPRAARLIALGMCALVPLAAVEFFLCVFRYDNDFLWHRLLGISFLQDQLYDAFGHHYLPARAMIDAATAWMPYRLDRAIWLLATCAGLAWCVRFWSDFERRPVPAWAIPALLALAVTGSYVHRDLVECGLQLFLLELLSVALWGLLHERSSLCGLSLGLAAVYKVTPLIFLPFLLWKRQWRAAGWMAGSTVFFCLLPGLFVGWQRNIELHSQWFDYAGRLMAQDDPAENGIEPATMHNQSLPVMLARLVEDFPEGHPLYIGRGPLARWARFDPLSAKRFMQGALLVFALGLAWRFRRSIDLTDGGEAIAWEWSAMCSLTALLSPMCWLQHLVLVIPTALLFAQYAAAGRARRWQWNAAGAATALMLLVHKDLLGLTLCDLLSSYQPHTVASVLLVVLAIGTRLPGPSANAAEEVSPNGYSLAA